MGSKYYLFAGDKNEVSFFFLHKMIKVSKQQRFILYYLFAGDTNEVSIFSLHKMIKTSKLQRFILSLNYLLYIGAVLTTSKVFTILFLLSL